MFTATEGELYKTASFDAGADDFIEKTQPIPSLVSRLGADIQRNARLKSAHSEK